MSTSITLNWNHENPKEIYSRQLSECPLYWHDETDTWVTYSYEYCKAILLNPDAHIPEPVITASSWLSDRARLLVNNLARLSNGHQHAEARNAAMRVYKYMRPVSIAKLMEALLKGVDPNSEFDYVEVIGKKLPVLIILKGLGFFGPECKYITDHVGKLVKIMSPAIKKEEIAEINKVVDEFYHISEIYIKANRLVIDPDLTAEKCTQLFICNLVGLFIQSYDAGRALLCNTLLNMVDPIRGRNLDNPDYCRKFVIENLRLDTPVHNTRRIAVNDIAIGGKVIKAGQKILITVGAANLDEQIFKDPLAFDPSRSNNNDNLTFGIGGHMCLAKHLMIDMAVEACSYLHDKYPQMNVLPQEFTYEPPVNVRMIKKMMIKLA